MSHQEDTFIRQAIQLAIKAGKEGHNPFGSILVHEGVVIEEGSNDANNSLGSFGHAEFNLIHKSVKKYSDTYLGTCTLYTSTAPCVRCLMAIASAKIPRIVYSVSYEKFALIQPIPMVQRDYPRLLEELGIEMEMIGPILEEEGLAAYAYRGGNYRPLEEVLEDFAQQRARYMENQRKE